MISPKIRGELSRVGYNGFPNYIDILNFFTSKGFVIEVTLHKAEYVTNTGTYNFTWKVKILYLKIDTIYQINEEGDYIEGDIYSAWDYAFLTICKVHE